MSDIALRRSSTTLPTAALALGILALVVYWVGGITLDGAGWVTGFVLGIVAVVVGFVARREPEGRTRATVGLVLGAIPVLWFVGYVLIDAVA